MQYDPVDIIPLKAHKEICLQSLFLLLCQGEHCSCVGEWTRTCWVAVAVSDIVYSPWHNCTQQFWCCLVSCVLSHSTMLGPIFGSYLKQTLWKLPGTYWLCLSCHETQARSCTSHLGGRESHSCSSSHKRHCRKGHKKKLLSSSVSWESFTTKKLV